MRMCSEVCRVLGDTFVRILREIGEPTNSNAPLRQKVCNHFRGETSLSEVIFTFVLCCICQHPHASTAKSVFAELAECKSAAYIQTYLHTYVHTYILCMHIIYIYIYIFIYLHVRAQADMQVVVWKKTSRSQLGLPFM